MLSTGLVLHPAAERPGNWLPTGISCLNGRRVNIPSIEVKIGDQRQSGPKAEKPNYFKQIDDVSPNPSDIPIWMKVNRKKFEISITGLPSRSDAEPDINESLIVEYYSR